MTPKANTPSVTESNLFHQIRTFLLSYITFPDPAQADICALWAIGTHVYKRFDAFPYLVITASTKRAGKSQLAGLLSKVAHDAKLGTSMSASVMRRLVAKGATLFFDEAESLNSEAASAVREYLNVGYRAGQSVFMPGAGPDDVIEYPAFSPKAFILIGDVNDTLRDRSIIIELRRASNPAMKIFRNVEADAEAKAMDIDASDIDQALDGDPEDIDLYAFLDGREAEIWTPLFQLAQAYCPERIPLLTRMAVDMGTLKQTTDKRRFSEIRATEEKRTADAAFAERAMRDVHAIMQGHSKMFTDAMIEALKAIDTAPWRTYRGDGLTPVMLSDLLSVFGVATRWVKINAKSKRGLQRADVEAGYAKLK